jgi:IclR family transcriptional regulator, KDG regulon repressor
LSGSAGSTTRFDVAKNIEYDRVPQYRSMFLHTEHKRMRSGISSVANAIALLKTFSDERFEMGITELAARLGVAKSTAHRLAATLVETGMLEQNRENEKYRLGFAAFELGALVRRKMDASTEAKGSLLALRERTGETVHLAILDSDEIVYINYLESRNAVRISSAIGLRKPAHCTAEGKAILAFQPTEDGARLKNLQLERRTPRTISDSKALAAELAAIRAQGFAVDDEESEIGMRCIAAPICDETGHATAAVGIAGPIQRLPKKLLLSFAPAVIKATDEISLRLGGTQIRTKRA